MPSQAEARSSANDMERSISVSVGATTGPWGDRHVQDALSQLAAGTAERFVAEIGAWLVVRDRKLAAARRRGGRVSPFWLLPLSRQLAHEAARRTAAGDETAPAWHATSASARDRLETSGVTTARATSREM